MQAPNDDSPTPRWAVYWTPPRDHPLWVAGCRWLGRDPWLSEAPEPAGPLRRDAWRYGFHATLKPPLHPARADDLSGFVADVAHIARRHRRFQLPALELGWMDGFLVLRPSAALGPAHPLRRLADDLVIGLDAWRRPPSPAELARRHVDALDTAHRALLMRWGYAHVLEAWRFHLTLSDRPADGPHGQLGEALAQQAQACFSPVLLAPCPVDAVSVFVEPGPGSPLRAVHQLSLAP